MDINSIEKAVAEARERYHRRLHLDGMNTDIGTYASGNWGHHGLKGQVGGSSKGGGKANRGAKMKDGTYTSAAKERKQAEKAVKESKVKQEGKKQESKMTEALRKYVDDRETYTQKWKEFDEAQNEIYNLNKKYNYRNPNSWSQEDKDMYDALSAKMDTLNRERHEMVKNYDFTSDIDEALFTSEIDYNAVTKRSKPLSDDEIIRTISGGDLTEGACASVALVYAAQKQGYDILDFRGGESREFFSSKDNQAEILQDLGIEPMRVPAKGEYIDPEEAEESMLTNTEFAVTLLDGLDEGKEYYFSAGRHASIVRIKEGRPQYLELQSDVASENGWTDFDEEPRVTFETRFGCGATWDSDTEQQYMEARAIDISQFTGDVFEKYLGYINTKEAEQEKGAGGGVR